MSWECPAITNGVVVYDDNRIRPCCVVHWSYNKPASEINNPDRFSDIYENKETNCKKCIDQEANNIVSLRQHYLNAEEHFNPRNTTNLKFLDFRNSNLCNAKCRICGDTHSSKWHQERYKTIEIRQVDIEPYLDKLLSGDVIEIYFAGGEPMLMASHFQILHKCIELGISKNINLRYSINLSTLKYKDEDVVELWKHFNSLHVMASADGVGELYNSMRSDLNWDTYERNAAILQENNIPFEFFFVLNNLNIWFLKETLDYVKSKNWKYNIEVIRGSEELTLGKIPSDLVSVASEIINSCDTHLTSSIKSYIMSQLTGDNTNTFNNVLIKQQQLDKLRNENLVELLKEKGVIIEK